MTATANAPAGRAFIHSVQIGRAAPLGPDGVMSGFVKRPVSGSVDIHLLGLAGDEQVDLRVHGGRYKAVYAYGLGNYAAWLREFPSHAALLSPGGLGENLTIDGWDETYVCIGDVVRAGTSMLQVSQPRQPCFKFALRFADIAMPRAMIRSGLSGWYYSVLEAGKIAAGDEVVVTARPYPSWSISRVNRSIVQRRGSPAERQEYAEMNKALGLLE